MDSSTLVNIGFVLGLQSLECHTEQVLLFISRNTALLLSGASEHTCVTIRRDYGKKIVYDVEIVHTSLHVVVQDCLLLYYLVLRLMEVGVIKGHVTTINIVPSMIGSMKEITMWHVDNTIFAV
jgi:hypothetical protein